MPEDAVATRVELAYSNEARFRVGRTVAWIVGLWLLAHVVLVAGHVAHVFLYSVTIAPGLTNEAYRAYAQVSAPWFSIIFGGPVFYAIGRILTKRAETSPRKAGVTVWALYTATDAAIVLLSLSTLPVLLAAQWVISQSVKLVGVLWGTRAEG